jgi:hypothetical protein
MKCLTIPDGGFFTGVGNESVFYAKYLQNGKKAWFHEYPKTDTLQVSVDVAMLTPTTIAVAEQKTSGAKIKFFSPEGKINKVTDLNGNIKIDGLAATGNSLGIVANNGNLLIFKFISETSF